MDHDRNPVTYIADPPQAVEGDLASSHWCLLANPATYDVEAALRALPVVLWNVGRLRRNMPAPGDAVLVWRTLGADGHRGLIGRGIVDGYVSLVPDNEDPFWADSARGLVVERRVPIRWTPLVEPVWLDQEPEILGALKVSRSQGFSMVAEEPEIWTAAARLAHPRTAGRQTRTPRGQGWMTVVEQRLAIERAAMDAAVAHYQSKGYTIEDVHLRESYDLRCTRDDDEIHLEVKGTTTEALRVLLTRGEVLHARATSHAALFVLHGLSFDATGEHLTAWTEESPLIIDPWEPADSDLVPLSYQYTLPAGGPQFS